MRAVEDNEPEKRILSELPLEDECRDPEKQKMQRHLLGFIVAAAEPRRRATVSSSNRNSRECKRTGAVPLSRDAARARPDLGGTPDNLFVLLAGIVASACYFYRRA